MYPIPEHYNTAEAHDGGDLIFYTNSDVGPSERTRHELIGPLVDDNLDMTPQFDLVAAGGAATLDGYQSEAIKTWKRGPFGIAYLALGLAGEAGETAEKFKKWLRDDKPATLVDLPDDARREAIVRELGDTLWYLSAIAFELGVPLSRVAAANLEKTQGRRARGTLHGEGDDR